MSSRRQSSKPFTGFKSSHKKFKKKQSRNERLKKEREKLSLQSKKHSEN